VSQLIIKRLVLISGILVVSLSLLIFLINTYDSKKKAEIMHGMDTRLSSFDIAKSTAEQVQDLISIRNQEDYDTQRQKFSKMMSQSLFADYFPTVKYKGGDKSFSITHAVVTGDIVSDTHFTFKVELVLRDKGVDIPVTLLVFIKDNIMYKIQSLG
jgi:hypothetical protein